MRPVRRGTIIGALCAMIRSAALQMEAPSWLQATTVFAVFLAVQVLDGLLTYAGITMLGVEAEGNALLVTSIRAIGAPRALLAAKLLACVCGYILFRTRSYRALAVAAGLYIGVAIVPWLGILGNALR